MKPKLTRREFLRFAKSLTLMPVLNFLPTHRDSHPLQGRAKPNIILILFDALSANNLSLYGYPRQTSPNLERFASRANVYHAHHSAANFTTPSTASLFTGTYPWTHRAFHLSSLITPAFRPKNLFGLVEGIYTTVAFTQNVYADMLLYQFQDNIDNHVRLDSFTLVGNVFYNKYFARDGAYALKAIDQFLFKRQEAHGSLLLSFLNDLDVLFQEKTIAERFADIYPEGLPRLANTDLYYSLSQVTDGLRAEFDGLSTPSFFYIHLMPPHEPYVPTRQFLGSFSDGWSPPQKKKHRLAPGVAEERLVERRQTYDEFIANLDAEFGRLLEVMEKSGLLDNSYVIVTSDHGELFERGAHGHSTPLVFEPVVRIPLIISTPGQNVRNDIHALTSNIDLLPTILHLSGLPSAEWCEGGLLPGLGGVISPERSIFIVESKSNPAFSPLRKFTAAMIKGQYKIVRYMGYRNYKDEFELYDLENDPEEFENRYDPSHPIVKDLQHELEQKLQEADQPYL